MNVHGTHESAIRSLDAHGATPKPNNDCQIQAAEFARMLTQLIDKSAESSGDHGRVADAPVAPAVKPER
jgi:hypothetical protein